MTRIGAALQSVNSYAVLFSIYDTQIKSSTGYYTEEKAYTAADAAFQMTCRMNMGSVHCVRVERVMPMDAFKASHDIDPSSGLAGDLHLWP